jgi:hypothetical protein
MSNDLGKNIQLISCIILLRLVAKNTNQFGCSGGAFVFRECACVGDMRNRLTVNEL